MCITSYAQKSGEKKSSKNLIPNSSFEEFTNKSNDISNAKPWVGVGTVDFFMKPEKRDTSHYKGARTGANYAGLRFQKEYKEYMYVPLTETLQEGSVYHFEMFVRLLTFENVTVTIKELGAYFSEEPFNEGMVFYKEGVVDSSNEYGIAGTRNWMRIQGNYTALGGEKYVILGNFRTKMKEDFVKKNKTAIFEFEEGYYYVDDVSLYKKNGVKDSTKKIKTSLLPVFTDTFTVGQSVEIKDIQFEDGGTRISKLSYKIVNELARVLNDHPFMEVQIDVKMSNHTDAKIRAKAICDYLKEQGVINTLKHKGEALSDTTDKSACVVNMIVIKTGDSDK
jgi:outer membrane protein OmpA-like peptidoglycan-associated protein